MHERVRSFLTEESHQLLAQDLAILGAADSEPFY